MIGGVQSGVYRPVECTLTLERQVVQSFPVVAVIEQIKRYAGAAVGSATVRYPARYAQDLQPEMGRWGFIKIGSAVVFRGCVGDVPVEIDPHSDSCSLLLFDDKWLMERNTIGQPDIGSVTEDGVVYGFPDVGCNVVFNADSKPNKSPDALTFRTGSGAVYWKLVDVLQFLFAWYSASDEVRLTAGVRSTLSSAWQIYPANLSLMGKTLLQAVDACASIAGESWGLKHETDHSAFVPVRPAAGTERIFRMAPPKGGMTAAGVTEFFPSSVRPSVTVKDSHDYVQVSSAPIVKEHTYTNKGENPLLIPVAFTDKTYAVRFAVDVTQYAAHGLGRNLSAGAPPKLWLSNLLTRRAPSGVAYLTAAEIVADPQLRYYDPEPQHFIWVSADGSVENAKLVLGGVRLNNEYGTLDFEAELDVAHTRTDAADTVEKDVLKIVPVTSGVWLTIATRLEYPQSYATSRDSAFLPKLFCQHIVKESLVPERRDKVWLPDLASADKNAIARIAADAEETYVDITSTLQATAQNALAESNQVERTCDFEFPCFPVLEIGDRVKVQGRTLPLSGDEVIVDLHYDVHEAYVTRAKATNIVAGISPERFEEMV